MDLTLVVAAADVTELCEALCDTEFGEPTVDGSKTVILNWIKAKVLKNRVTEAVEEVDIYNFDISFL